MPNVCLSKQTTVDALSRDDTYRLLKIFKLRLHVFDLDRYTIFFTTLDRSCPLEIKSKI